MRRTKPLQRKTPLRSQTAIVRTSKLRPVSKKRAASRRKKGTVEDFHIKRVAALPCLACGACPVHVHHVTAPITGGRIARSDNRVTPLCPAHHKTEFGRESVESLSHGGFYATHGIDLLAEADRLWAETMALWMQAHGLTTAAQMEAAE